MTKHRSHSAAFKRQVAGETLHALSKRHDISRQLIRIWVGKFEAGALDDDVLAADLIQEYEARIAALERLVGKQALDGCDNEYWPLELTNIGPPPDVRSVEPGRGAVLLSGQN